jgi:glycosyltransferase involved in cell wall biosynthesis
MTTATVQLAYLLKRFPRLSETFILHEILALEHQGIDLRLYSILEPAEEVIHRDVSRVRARITYFPAGSKALVDVVRNHLSLLQRTPRRYLSVVAYITRKRRSVAALKHFARAGWLAAELEREGVTHLHAHFAHGPASVAHFVSLLTGMPYSFTAHAKDIYTSPPDLLAVKMRAARFVVTCTGFNVEYLNSLTSDLPSEHVRRIYHGVDLSKFRPRTEMGAVQNPQDTAIVLAVGRLVEKKGFSYLIAAFGRLIEQGVNAKLLIVGSGPDRDSLYRRVRELELSDKVTFLGARTQDEVIDIYRQATVLALPCIVTENGDRDGIPNVLVEAMRMGVPVISTSISGIPELVRDGESGVLVPPRDDEALARGIARLLADSNLRLRMSQAAMQRVCDEFDLSVNAEHLANLFRRGAA